jgi:hypothetical protein
MIFQFAPGSYRILHFGTVEVATRTMSAKLLVDTGCTRTTFRSEFLKELGAIPANVSPTLITTGSDTVRGTTYVLHDLHALGQSTGPTTVLGMDLSPDLEYDGMIGMDFLIKLKMTIDFPRGTIRILKPTKPTKPRTQRK